MNTHKECVTPVAQPQDTVVSQSLAVRATVDVAQPLGIAWKVPQDSTLARVKAVL